MKTYTEKEIETLINELNYFNHQVDILTLKNNELQKQLDLHSVGSSNFKNPIIFAKNKIFTTNYTFYL